MGPCASLAWWEPSNGKIRGRRIPEARTKSTVVGGWTMQWESTLMMINQYHDIDIINVLSIHSIDIDVNLRDRPVQLPTTHALRHAACLAL